MDSRSDWNGLSSDDKARGESISSVISTLQIHSRGSLLETFKSRITDMRVISPQ